jgi:peptidoglycan/LPS O-acetylase OafA/YrhL
VFTYQPALDGVRALAVTAVLIFHAGVVWLPGGFLGVDAFFVLSGFLITSLLLGERAKAGRIRLGAFWLRRARRLLPALLLLVAFVAIAFRGILTTLDLRLLRDDALAALGYVANWRMIYRGDDYFTQTAAPSPLQHTWSLGIEEQFYVLWPLIVVAVLWAGAYSRRLLLALCIAGAAVSAIVCALLYDPFDINRAYFGTDARAQALLIGCALAALLHGKVDRAAAPSTGRRRWPAWVLAAAAGAGVLVVAWLWLDANGVDPLLYRGGFALGGLAVAAVLAHCVLRPQALLARVLSVAPLVWLGKISYGVYLWHWPLFDLLNHERTGMTGTSLLMLRFAATLAAATASYVLLERPVRTGRWPFPMPRLSGPASGATATAAIGITALVVLSATAVRVVPTVASLRGAPLVVNTPQPNAAQNPPMLREGRKPGELPRIAFYGDSVSWSIGFYLPSYADQLDVKVDTLEGCGIARLPEIRVKNMPQTNYDWCPTWDKNWQYRIDTTDPDVAVLLLARWELMDRKLGGRFQHVGEPAMDRYLRQELDLALDILLSRGAHVVILTAPYNKRYERPNGELYDEDLPERVDAWNKMLHAAAAEHDERTTVIDLNRRVCPDGEFTYTIDRIRIRSDGLHFSPNGVRQWIAPWLMPQLARIATGAIYAVERGD